MTPKTLRTHFPELSTAQAEAILKPSQGLPHASAHDHSWRVCEVLHLANQALEGFGIERLHNSTRTKTLLVYVNMGETYQKTLAYDYTKEKFVVTSWGDWVETYERRGGRVY